MCMLIMLSLFEGEGAIEDLEEFFTLLTLSLLITDNLESGCEFNDLELELF